MWTRSKKDSQFEVMVWNAENELTFVGVFANHFEADRVGEAENRKALAPIMGDSDLPEMTDDELLAELRG